MISPKDSTQTGSQTTFSRLHESFLGEKYYGTQHFYVKQISEYQLFWVGGGKVFGVLLSIHTKLKANKHDDKNLGWPND